MRKQYHLWPTDAGFDAWDVDRLIELSRGLPVQAVTVASISEVDTEYWFEGSAAAPTVRNVVEHARLMLEGVAEVSSVRFPSPVEPDYRNVQPDQLPY